MDQGLDELGQGVATLFLLALTLAVLGFLLVLYLLGFWFIRTYFTTGEDDAEEGPPAPGRLFGAPPVTRWFAAYDHWLYRLEQTTGFDFNTTPSRLLAGSVIVSVGPALLVGSLCDVIDPQTHAVWMPSFGLIALVVGTFTGFYLARPATGWFDALPGDRPSSVPGAEEEDFIILGEDE